jgi:transcriptional regulator of acetoin/glycerol metabolism
LSTADPQTIADRDLKPLLRESRTPDAEAHGEPSFSLEGLERMALQRALRLCKGNRTKAASMLGISRDTLYRKLRQYGDGS